ncbi:MAG: hypothetical protein CMF49_06460 [Legionellales bacterium]|nr:hypothetical protein [Legionellales bacterium]|tara:strand:- start:98 stop:655 length:558 start_codon:yes stop_codon:yes gene_type:complete
MKKFITISFLGLSAISNTLFAAEADCNGLIQEVSRYINNPTENKQMANKAEKWKNINWIQQQMGKGTKNTVSKKTYFWSNFGLVTINDSVVAQIGEMPQSLKKVSIDGLPSLNDTNQILGKATSIKTQLFYRYAWVCTDTGSNLIVNTNTEGNVLGVAGMSCNSSVNDATNSPDCVGFSTIKGIN